MSMTLLSKQGKVGKRDADANEYRQLLGKSLPHVVRDEKENEYYIDLLASLDAKIDPTPAEKELADLLTVLIEDFEDKHYALKKAGPIENLTELMRDNGLKQKDLIGIFGTASIASEVLNGKRGLTTQHILKLSERFHVTPELFI